MRSTDPVKMHSFIWIGSNMDLAGKGAEGFQTAFRNPLGAAVGFQSEKPHLIFRFLHIFKPLGMLVLFETHLLSKKINYASANLFGR